MTPQDPKPPNKEEVGIPLWRAGVGQWGEEQPPFPAGEKPCEDDFTKHLGSIYAEKFTSHSVGEYMSICQPVLAEL